MEALAKFINDPISVKSGARKRWQFPRQFAPILADPRLSSRTFPPAGERRQLGSEIERLRKLNPVAKLEARANDTPRRKCRSRRVISLSAMFSFSKRRPDDRCFARRVRRSIDSILKVPLPVDRAGQIAPRLKNYRTPLRPRLSLCRTRCGCFKFRNTEAEG